MLVGCRWALTLAEVVTFDEDTAAVELVELELAYNTGKVVAFRQLWGVVED